MNESIKSVLKRAFQYLFQGIVVIAPIAITVYCVFWLFTTIDSLLPNLFSKIAPGTVPDEHRMPGVGFIVIVLLLMLIGRASSSFIFGHLLDFLGSLLEKTPGIKLIYSSVKDFLKAFSGSQKKFDKPVMVNVDATDVWRIGFITQTDANKFHLPEHVIVYVPFSYAISGMTYLVPKDKIRFIENEIHSAEAMKFVISGGVTELEK
ncbi:hypothetical protein A9P82_11605 [Arachidicoccus ginsenosidimutans]|uniref:DUF502 domain-containing protein n=1 Tax=Arachidicoccus sp. BS20 TaxID=1850526 RepID=UPI0007F12BA6|nr:DUF502 domain-containing protein [Arachidicoccus sp. BS20]ANI89875.1 hypothetical protein A9P82_11605 [Arachidicoccus sp. BS20]